MRESAQVDVGTRSRGLLCGSGCTVVRDTREKCKGRNGENGRKEKEKYVYCMSQAKCVM